MSYDKGNVNLVYDLYPVLNEIDKNNDNIVSKNAYYKILNSGEYISSVNGACNGVIFIIKGKISIKRVNPEGDETYLYNISEGELCHEALQCLLNYKPLNIIGTAITDSFIYVVPIKIVKEYLFKSVNFLSYMYKDIYQKFNILIDKKEDINNKSVEERVREYLEKHNSNIIYCTHKEIADEIDSSREVVSRALKKLEKVGYLKLERGKIFIKED